MKKIIASLLCLSFFSLSPMTMAANTVQVHTGLKIPLRVQEKQTSRNLVAGSKINMEIANDVYHDNILIFKKGDKATLNVTDAKKAGFLGHAGEFILTDGEVYDIKGIVHPLDFTQTYTGEEKTYPKVLLTVSVFFLFPLALFGFVKGGQAQINTTQIINAHLGESFNL